LIAGLSVSIFVSLAYFRSFPSSLVFGIRRIFFVFVYFCVLFWEIIKANIDVALRVLNPALPIKPGIVEIKTSLKSDAAKVALANSITLTPGTLTLDIIGDKLFIHWINVTAEDPQKAAAVIAGRFERYLKKIFE